MKTFNERHTVSFYGRFTEDKKKETEIAKKQKILDLNEKQFCTEYCKHKETPCKGTCKEFEQWEKTRKQKKVLSTNENINAFIDMNTYVKQPLNYILINLSVNELEELLRLLPDTRALTKKCLVENELKRRKQ